MAQFYTLGVILFGSIMFVLYLVKYRTLTITTWKPGAAWTRAMIYFSICNLISIWTGTTETMVMQSISTPNKLSNSMWIGIWMKILKLENCPFFVIIRFYS